MRKMMRRISGCLLLAGLVLTACSVKEDRTDCPCTLEVEFLHRELIRDPLTLVGYSTDAMVFDDNVTTADYPDVYRRSVPRGMLFFGAVQGFVNNRHEGHQVVIPRGQECDSLYACHDYVDCTGEIAHTAVDLHKQFATVTLMITNTDFVPADYSFVIESGTSGIDILTCQGVAGYFTLLPTVDADHGMRFRLPRQCDDSLVLKVTHSSGDNVTFPLGRYIHGIGYDWDALDLQDIFITLDIARGEVRVGVARWEEVDDAENIIQM